MQEFTGVYREQREALYELVKLELFSGVVIKKAALEKMIYAISQYMKADIKDANFLARLKAFRDDFISLVDKKLQEFITHLESDNNKGISFPAENADKYQAIAEQIWRLVFCHKARYIESNREFRKYIETIIEPKAKNNVLELHTLYHNLYRSSYVKKLTLNNELPIEDSQLNRFRCLIECYTQHVMSSKATDAPFNFQGTEDPWLNPFIESINDIVDEFSGLTDDTRTAIFAQLIEDGEADGLAIIDNEEYPEQDQDRAIWRSLENYWPELMLLYHDPEASCYFNSIFVQGRNKLILSPKESLELQKRVKVILIEKMESDKDRGAELERLQRDNANLRKQLAELLAKSNEQVATVQVSTPEAKVASPHNQEPAQSQGLEPERESKRLKQMESELDQAFQQVRLMESERDQALQQVRQVESKHDKMSEQLRETLVRVVLLETERDQALEQVKLIKLERDEAVAKTQLPVPFTLPSARTTSLFGKKLNKSGDDAEAMKTLNRSFKTEQVKREEADEGKPELDGQSLSKKAKPEADAPLPPQPPVAAQPRFFLGVEGIATPVAGSRFTPTPILPADAQRCARELVLHFKTPAGNK